jgi:hypothetical protein
LNNDIDAQAGRAVRELPELDYRGAKAFDNLLLDCIDEALTNLFSARVRESVYDHMERNYSIARDEIPNHLDDLITLLQRNFGSGSKVIGRAVAKGMYTKLDWEFEPIPIFGLAEYLETIRARIATQLMQRAKNDLRQ